MNGRPTLLQVSLQLRVAFRRSGDRQSVHQKEEKFFLLHLHLHGVEDLWGHGPFTFVRSFVTWAHLAFPLPGLAYTFRRPIVVDPLFSLLYFIP